MIHQSPMHEFVSSQIGRDARTAVLDRKSLRGGSEAASVTLVTVRLRDETGRARLFRFVAKELRGRPIREAAVYRKLAAIHARDFSPRLLGVDDAGPNYVTLYIEAITRVSAW